MAIIGVGILVILAALLVVPLIKLLWHLATITVGEVLQWAFFSLLPFLVTILFPVAIVAAAIWLVSRAASPGPRSTQGCRPGR